MPLAVRQQYDKGGIAMLEPKIVRSLTSQAAREAKELLRNIGVNEKHWPPGEVDALLNRGDSRFTVVYDVASATFPTLVGAGQVLLERPSKVDEIFPGVLPATRRVYEASFTGIKPEFRGSKRFLGVVPVLAALLRSVFHAMPTNFEAISCLLDNSILRLYNKIGLPFRKVSSTGIHYWCGTLEHGEQCKLVWACELDFAEAARVMPVRVPEFWEYINLPCLLV